MQVGAAEAFEVVMCRLWPGAVSRPKPAVKSRAKPGFGRGFPKPVALALVCESRKPWPEPRLSGTGHVVWVLVGMVTPVPYPSYI